MSDTPRERWNRNEGIQAKTVQAEVLAVGRGARAIKSVAAGDAEALAQAIAQLREAIAGLGLQPAAREVLERDVSALAEDVQSGGTDGGKAESRLRGIADKLKMVGVVLGDVAALAEPVTKIAGLLRIPLSFLAGG
jgi:hypothetical protein